MKKSLNVKKSCFMVFKPRQKRELLDVTVSINNMKIKGVKEVLVLGVVIEESMSWKPHIAQVVSKVSKTIGILYKSSFFLSKSSLHTLYYSLDYPYIHYCMLVWGSTNPSNLERLFLLQKRAIRVINKNPFDARTDPTFNPFTPELKKCILPAFQKAIVWVT